MSDFESDTVITMPIYLKKQFMLKLRFCLGYFPRINKGSRVNVKDLLIDLLVEFIFCKSND